MQFENTETGECGQSEVFTDFKDVDAFINGILDAYDSIEIYETRLYSVVKG